MITLTCRLLCASRVAYAVTANAPPTACPPYDGIAGFLSILLGVGVARLFLGLGEPAGPHGCCSRQHRA